MHMREYSQSRIASGLLALVTVACLLVVAAPGATAGPTPTLNPPIQWSAFNNGRVSVVFPGAFPEVDLYQDANTSVNAALQLDGIFELAPGDLPRPTIIAQAFPTATAGFNVTTTTNLTQAPLALDATLEVRTSYASLWTPVSGPSPAAGAYVGGATLRIAYSAAAPSSPGSGVQLNWSVVGWPWVHTTDLLAIEFQFTAPNAPNIAACTTAQPLATPTSACSGEPLAARTIVWDSSLASLEGVAPTGPIASLAWAAAPPAANGSSVPYTVGAFAGTNGTAELILAAPAAPALEGSAAFTLSAPTHAPAPVLLRGTSVVYLGTLGIVGGAAVVLVLLYRRRNRRLTAEL